MGEKETIESSKEAVKAAKPTLKERLKSMKEWDRTTKIYVVVFLCIMGIAVVLGILWARNQNIFYEWIILYFVRPIGGLGPIGWLIFLLFMTLQSILMPIPSEVVLLGAGAIWGLWGGFVLGMIGSMLCAIMAYQIAARGGGPVVEKFLGKENIEIVDVYLQKYGAWVVFVMRAIPFIGFDPVSYVSGLLKINFKKYVLANLFGCISRCLFYAWLGYTLTGGFDYITGLSEEELETLISAGAADFNIIIIIILSVLIAFAILYNLILIPYLKRKRASEMKTLSEEDQHKLEEINKTEAKEGATTGTLSQGPPKKG